MLYSLFKMKFDKLHILADNTQKAQITKRKIIKKLKNFKINACNCIVVLGGDGFMLHMLKKYQRWNKPFYGLNTGNRGFLLNHTSYHNLLKKIENANVVQLSPLEATIAKNKTKKKVIAINEISIFRQHRQTTKLEIKVDSRVRVKELVGDGVLIATPAGSTAYNLSARGPILNLDSQYLTVTPISPFRPRGWRGAIVNNQSSISIKNLDTKKRPVSAVADNIEVRNIKSVNIQLSKKIKFKILYNKKFGLKERNIAEQFKF